MPYKDRSKQLEYQRNWNKRYYLLNKESERLRISLRKRSLRDLIMRIKSNLSCKFCSEAVCLDFHHKGDNKSFNLADVASWGWGIEKIEKEITKCDVVCANCHRKVHAGLLEN